MSKHPGVLTGYCRVCNHHGADCTAHRKAVRRNMRNRESEKPQHKIRGTVTYIAEWRAGKHWLSFTNPFIKGLPKGMKVVGIGLNAGTLEEVIKMHEEANAQKAERRRLRNAPRPKEVYPIFKTASKRERKEYNNFSLSNRKRK